VSLIATSCRQQLRCRPVKALPLPLNKVCPPKLLHLNDGFSRLRRCGTMESSLPSDLCLQQLHFRTTKLAIRYPGYSTTTIKSHRSTTSRQITTTSNNQSLPLCGLAKPPRLHRDVRSQRRGKHGRPFKADNRPLPTAPS
jgi:hypothetical protein